MSERATHCIGRCGRPLNYGVRSGKAPKGTARHGGHGLCEACYKATGGQFPMPVLPDTSLPYATFLPPSWTADARCAETDPKIFYPENGHNAPAAKAICAGCPVRDACLTWALERREGFGVWGGLSAKERDRLLKARRAA